LELKGDIGGAIIRLGRDSHFHETVVVTKKKKKKKKEPFSQDMYSKIPITSDRGWDLAISKPRSRASGNIRVFVRYIPAMAS
jgi:hypothetical protein